VKKLLLSLTLCCSLVFPAFAEITFPEPVGLVNDFADILSPEAELQITIAAAEIDEKNGAELTVVTVQSLQGYEVNDYGVKLFREWGVGHPDRNDGVLFLTSVDDRVTYIVTGYGVEEYITDAQTYWITDRAVVPHFKQGDYDAGILAGVEEIRKALVDLEALPELEGGGKGSVFSLFSWAFIIIFIISFVFPWLAAIFGRSKAWWPGGVAGGGVGALLAFLFEMTYWFALPLALFGFLFDYLASNDFKSGKKKWYTGGGRSGWGGGGFGGGSSGGGFGGFSGGSTGGGGGGSSW